MIALAGSRVLPPKMLAKRPMAVRPRGVVILIILKSFTPLYRTSRGEIADSVGEISPLANVSCVLGDDAPECGSETSGIGLKFAALPGGSMKSRHIIGAGALNAGGFELSGRMPNSACAASSMDGLRPAIPSGTSAGPYGHAWNVSPPNVVISGRGCRDWTWVSTCDFRLSFLRRKNQVRRTIARQKAAAEPTPTPTLNLVVLVMGVESACPVDVGLDAGGDVGAWLVTVTASVVVMKTVVGRGELVVDEFVGVAVGRVAYERPVNPMIVVGVPLARWKVPLPVVQLQDPFNSRVLQQ